MENTARIYIIGAAAVLVSGVKLEDWKLVEKHAPEMMKMVDENGETVFRVACGDDGGSATQDGICWGHHTSEDGCATVTALLSKDIEDKRQAVSDIMGSALLDLLELEKEIPDTLVKIREDLQKADALITVK